MKNLVQKFIRLFVVVSIFFLHSCTTNDIDSSGSNLKYDKVCDVETRILKSYGDTVRIEYEPTRMVSADNMASEYCLHKE